jgi:hypothetical protein
MSLEAMLRWLEATPIAVTIAENEVLFPWIESLHVLAITLVVGSIFIVDLRLLGLASRDRAAKCLMQDVLPLTWGAFALAATTGLLMFSAKATTYGHNRLFLTKLALLALAGVNAATFHLFTGRRMQSSTIQTPLAARVAGGVSLTLWAGVVTCGRWVGFTLR